MTGLSSRHILSQPIPWALMSAPGDDIANRIATSGRSIYDDLSDRPDCVYNMTTLEARLDLLLRGTTLDSPIKTRAKGAKEMVARALGYQVPAAFKRTRPRFPGQNLDVHVQMSNNFQVWNEQVDPERRYVLIRVDAAGRVTSVRVLSGETIALLDSTGTLTTKYQAKRPSGSLGSRLVSRVDTDRFLAALRPRADLPASVLSALSPTARPQPGLVLPIHAVADRLTQLVGVEITDPGLVQERNRGAALQRLACQALTLGPYAETGQFPDVLCQALEVKFQLSPTVDLGHVAPDSTALADHLGHGLRYCDARYAVVYGSRVSSARVRVDAVVVSTGADFFQAFQRFEGRVQNHKLQLSLPSDLFEPEGSPHQSVEIDL